MKTNTNGLINFLKYILSFLIITFCWVLISAFVIGDFKLFEWSSKVRFIITLLSILSFVLLIGAIGFEKIKEEWENEQS